MSWFFVSAIVAACAQACFAYVEIRKWDVAFVRRAAPSWVDPNDAPEVTESHVQWAGDLAKNVGACNLLIALALVWTGIAAWNDWPTAAPFGVMLGLFLLVAALAARLTKVNPALVLQGLLGAALLVAAWGRLTTA